LIVLAYGLPGTGKSTLLHDLVRAQATTQLFFVNSHSLEWHPEASHWRGRPPPGMRIVQGEDALDEVTESPPESGVLVCMNCEAENIIQSVISAGHSTYVDDEIDLVAKKEGWVQSPLKEIVHRGRHLQNAEGEFTQCNILGACRRPQNLHTDMTDIYDEVYVFRLKGGNTKDRLKRDSLIEDDSEWDTVRALPNFHFKHHSPKGDVWLSIPPLGKVKPPPEQPPDKIPA
jgi:hypothetical protein